MRLGFDVGGTKTDAVVVAPGEEILARVRRPTGWGPDAVVQTVLSLVAELAGAVGILDKQFPVQIEWIATDIAKRERWF